MIDGQCQWDDIFDLIETALHHEAKMFSPFILHPLRRRIYKHEHKMATFVKFVCVCGLGVALIKQKHWQLLYSYQK